MSAPTPAVRAVMLERDGHRCAVCGVMTGLEAQHRRAVGMGGSKIRPGLDDLLSLCAKHNAACEAELQTLALARGWKVRRYVTDPGEVPVFYAPAGAWFRLTPMGARLPITAGRAAELMRAVYGAEWDEWEKELAA